MGLLQCTRCGCSTIAKSIEEGRKRLDHSIGLTVRKPCEDGKAPLEFTGADTKVKPTITTPKKIETPKIQPKPFKKKQSFK